MSITELFERIHAENYAKWKELPNITPELAIYGSATEIRAFSFVLLEIFRNKNQPRRYLEAYVKVLGLSKETMHAVLQLDLTCDEFVQHARLEALEPNPKAQN